MKKIIGRINSADQHVTIWGAGFAGLVLGYYLKSKGYRLTIYERSDRPGGKIATKKTGHGLVETAANALFLNEEGLELLHELKLEPIPATKKLRRFLLLDGKPRSPIKPGLLLKLGIRLRNRPPLISEGLSVADFFRPLLGQEMIDHYLSPILGGVYAAPAENLHFKSIFDRVGNKAQFNSYWDFIKTAVKPAQNPNKDVLRGSVSFEGGMQALIDRLAEELKAEIRLNYKENFRIKGNTIVCTDALNAAQLLEELRPEMAAELKRIRYQELSTTTVFLKRELKPLKRAFGVLIPQDAQFKASGILNNKAIFPSNNENVLSYTLIARKELTQSELEQDLQRLWPELEKEDIEHMEMTRWERGVPLYDLQRYLSIKRLHELGASETNFAIFGNYVAGISLREMIAAAKKFATDKN